MKITPVIQLAFFMVFLFVHKQIMAQNKPDKELKYNLGLNCLIDGNRAKLSLDYQNRPV